MSYTHIKLTNPVDGQVEKTINSYCEQNMEFVSISRCSSNIHHPAYITPFAGLNEKAYVETVEVVDLVFKIK